jgi:hypothetical protein
MTELLEAYRKQVLETLDYEEVYGDSCYESIRTELTPSLADALTEDQPLTQQRKRNLLIATNTAIESRFALCEPIDRERNSLEGIQNDLTGIESTLRDLPNCSLRRLAFEKFVTVWESYDELLERCDELAETRQRDLQEYESLGGSLGETHAINDYLYAGLETQFPALRAVTEMRQTIEQYREDQSETTGRRDDKHEPAVVSRSSG